MKQHIGLFLSFLGSLVLIAAGLSIYHRLKVQPPGRYPPPALGTFLPVTQFTAMDGHTVDLAAYHGNKYVLLVFMRGSSGNVCPACVQQTVDLLKHHQALAKAKVKVFIVYPGDRGTIPDFIAAVNHLYQGPKPVTAADLDLLLDTHLRAVKALGIEGDLARPSTFLLDLDGKVFYRYIGKSASDRPNWQAIEEVLEKLEFSGK